MVRFCSYHFSIHLLFFPFLPFHNLSARFYVEMPYKWIIFCILYCSIFARVVQVTFERFYFLSFAVNSETLFLCIFAYISHCYFAKIIHLTKEKHGAFPFVSMENFYFYFLSAHISFAFRSSSSSFQQFVLLLCVATWRTYYTYTTIAHLNMSDDPLLFKAFSNENKKYPSQLCSKVITRFNVFPFKFFF